MQRVFGICTPGFSSVFITFLRHPRTDASPILIIHSPTALANMNPKGPKYLYGRM